MEDEIVKKIAELLGSETGIETEKVYNHIQEGLKKREAEKLKKVVCMTNCIEELLEIDESVQQTINAIAQLECCIKEKAIYAMESLQELRHKQCCHK